MAEKPDILDAIEALAIHCRPPIMDAEQRSLWLRDWCSDLAQYPMEAIAAACRKWRHSGAVKFPTPGQLLPLVRESQPAERAEHVEVWRPLSDAEYAALTVREKIRHHQILSHEAYSKAGPMFRNTSQGPRMSGVHLAADDMDASYRKWTDLGKHHAQEAHRLRQYVRGAPQGLAAE
jgi:hypothetical protein